MSQRVPASIAYREVAIVAVPVPEFSHKFSRDAGRVVRRLRTPRSGNAVRWWAHCPLDGHLHLLTLIDVEVAATARQTCALCGRPQPLKVSHYVDRRERCT